MKVSFIIVCIVFFTTISYAGLTGFSFLKLSSDAKSAALSNMTTALPNYEASAIFLNPADLVFHKENNLLFNTTNFYNDLHFYNLSYSFQRLIYNYGIGIKNLKTVKVERTEIEGQNAIR
ncbi:MAG TPA: hypothetical protein PK189_09730, partial [bacterium]|nr:hypothetical protein [bacterium]